MSETASGGDAFKAVFDGQCFGVLRWEQLTALWERLRQDADAGWYIYAVGEPVPTVPVSGEELRRFLVEIDALLRREHTADYCGIVYTDDRDSPSLVKIYDPNNLGVVCGSSAAPPLPGWVLSKQRPIDLPAAFPPPRNRRRWWQRLFED